MFFYIGYMHTPIPDYLHEVLENTRDDGEVATYIPELARANPDLLASALCMSDGKIYAAGDIHERFTIQSISKPFVYALALQERGFETVLDKIGVEPSGESFNSASLDPRTQRPENPMVNIGAIATHALVRPEASRDERFEAVRAGLSAFAGRELDVDEAVYASEMGTAFRNMSLAYLVRSVDGFTQDPADIVEGYTRQCSILVDVRDLAVMAMTLANAGINPITQERVVDEHVAQQVLSVMTTCGMYDAAGDWMTQVGIPAKSGVAGGIIGALPGQVGAAVFSPRLDPVGNSVRGVQAFERFSGDMGMHLLKSPPLSRDVIRHANRRVSGQGEFHVIELQGPLRFSSAERVMRELEQIPNDRKTIALDLARVSSVDDVSRRMLMEGLRRLILEGHAVYLVDPRSSIPNRDLGDGTFPADAASLETLGLALTEGS